MARKPAAKKEAESEVEDDVESEDAVEVAGSPAPSVLIPVAEDADAAHEMARAEAEAAGVSPGAVMYSAPEGYGTGDGPVVPGEGLASHGDGSDFVASLS